MRHLIALMVLTSVGWNAVAQQVAHGSKEHNELVTLIDDYSRARETKDTVLLRNILMHDVDQLVSTGEWRYGVAEAIDGMLKSSNNNPGTRTLAVEKISLLSPKCAIVDCRYSIQNDNTEVRRMWSTFIVVSDGGKWKIKAIRNMLPSIQP